MKITAHQKPSGERADADTGAPVSGQARGSVDRPGAKALGNGSAGLAGCRVERPQAPARAAGITIAAWGVFAIAVIMTIAYFMRPPCGDESLRFATARYGDLSCYRPMVNK